MAVGCPKIMLPFTDVSLISKGCAFPWRINTQFRSSFPSRAQKLHISALSSGDGSIMKKKGAGARAAPNSNYVVPLDKASCLTRPLAEIFRDLNKRIPDNITKSREDEPTFIPWYQANRMLSFYAPGWCGEIRDVIFSENSSVTVVYRLTIRGTDGEAHRESTGTISITDKSITDPVAAAEQIAFCRACARFGLGLYLYHEE